MEELVLLLLFVKHKRWMGRVEGLEVRGKTVLVRYKDRGLGTRDAHAYEWGERRGVSVEGCEIVRV